MRHATTWLGSTPWRVQMIFLRLGDKMGNRLEMFSQLFWSSQNYFTCPVPFLPFLFTLQRACVGLPYHCTLEFAWGNSFFPVYATVGKLSWNVQSTLSKFTKSFHLPCYTSHSSCLTANIWTLKLAWAERLYSDCATVEKSPRNV